jgi:hypothetical protein
MSDKPKPKSYNPFAAAKRGKQEAIRRRIELEAKFLAKMDLNVAAKKATPRHLVDAFLASLAISRQVSNST